MNVNSRALHMVRIAGSSDAINGSVAAVVRRRAVGGAIFCENQRDRNREIAIRRRFAIKNRGATCLQSPRSTLFYPPDLLPKNRELFERIGKRREGNLSNLRADRSRPADPSPLTHCPAPHRFMCFQRAGLACRVVPVCRQRSFNWQSTAFVMRGLRVRFPSLAFWQKSNWHALRAVNSFNRRP
jgi:hypothetical protein